MKNQLFRVGGCVRDKILGVKTNDIDYTFVVGNPNLSVAQGFAEMEAYLKKNKFEIFLITADCYTIRARFPNDHVHKGLTADFVMARKEIGYYEGTRRPILELGTLEDDLFRRDFTLNAMAEDEEGNLIDPFGGLISLRLGVLRTPNDPNITMAEDPLRLLRAFRFSITRNFTIAPEINKILLEFDYERDMRVVSLERIREELFKCFKHNTLETIQVLHFFPNLRDYLFKNNLLWLKPTLEK